MFGRVSMRERMLLWTYSGTPPGSPQAKFPVNVSVINGYIVYHVHHLSTKHKYLRGCTWAKALKLCPGGASRTVRRSPKSLGFKLHGWTVCRKCRGNSPECCWDVGRGQCGEHWWKYRQYFDLPYLELFVPGFRQAVIRLRSRWGQSMRARQGDLRRVHSKRVDGLMTANKNSASHSGVVVMSCFLLLYPGATEWSGKVSVGVN